MRDTSDIADVLCGLREHLPAVVDARDPVGNLLEIAGDVSGYEDAALAVSDEVAQDVQHLLTGKGIEARSRLVEDEQLRIVGKGKRHLQLHAHAARELLYSLLQRDFELAQEVGELPVVPGVHGLPAYCLHGRNAHFGREWA